ncbi:MAG: S1 RNA-binding domain-containing protein [Ruminococcus sp.]|nr:S1 RNA-binding domain-containing protein [Ruminococcus sp.]
MNKYYPEGKLISQASNKQSIQTIQGIYEAKERGQILEAKAVMCDTDHNLLVDLPCCKGIIPRFEGAVGIDDGTTRDIALLSRVNKPVCFKVLSVEENGEEKTAILSRREAQLEAYENYIANLLPGDIIPAKVTHLEQFGCFVDICCGISSLIPIDAISVSRISHPRDRFYNGQEINAIVKSTDNYRIYLSHKELLGTWEQNASLFKAGQTVGGIIRSIESYGIFIELKPNLAGLAESRNDVFVGQKTSVYIKSIIPEKMKVKLIIVDVFDDDETDKSFDYYISSGSITHWEYSTKESERKIISVF